MKIKHVMIVAASAALVTAASVLAIGGDKTMVVPKAELKWKDMGNGVAAATVSGDMEKGASRFFLKYPAGLVTPMHHHTADHYGTLISGNIALTVDGKEHKLGPGDYFVLTGKAVHMARVEGDTDAVFFIQADAPWDAVMEEKK